MLLDNSKSDADIRLTNSLKTLAPNHNASERRTTRKKTTG